MQVAQRGTSVSGLGASEGYYTVDRFQLGVGGTATAGRLTMSQDSDAPDGFGSSLKLACTTADTSIAADENLRLVTVLEGQNLQAFKKGTANAESITLSFYVKGNASATYVIELFDTDNSRHICSTFPVTTSWQRVEITFAGDTTGAFGNDNGGSLRLHFWLHAGSNYTSGTLATSWAANNNANRAVGADSFYDSTSRTFQITGVQLEIGDTSTPFEHRSYVDQLQACRRYYHSIGTANYGGGYELLAHGFCDTTTRAIHLVHLPVQLRASPTLRTSGDYTKFYWRMPIGSPTTTTATALPTIGAFGLNFVRFDCSGSSMTVGYGCFFSQNNDTTAYIAFDAEL